MGIFHAGVEVFGEEWCFQYYEDTWEDPFISGVNRCLPRRMMGYEYVESVDLGRTPLTPAEADEIIARMSEEWPASSYHITRRNCLCFAEELAGALRTPRPFPAHLKGILEASSRNGSIDAIVDYSWSWMKWWMIRNTRQEQAEEAARLSGAPLPTTCGSTNWLLGACSTAEQEEQAKPLPRCASSDNLDSAQLGAATEVVLEVANPHLVVLPDVDKAR
jgi:hypothetical protein